MSDVTDPRRLSALLPTLVVFGWLLACGVWATDKWEWFGLDATRWLGPWRWAWLAVGATAVLPPVREAIARALAVTHAWLGRWAAPVLVAASACVGALRPDRAQGPDAGFLLERIPDGELATFSHPLTRYLLAVVHAGVRTIADGADLVLAFRVVGSVSFAAWVASVVYLARVLAPDDVRGRRSIVLASLSSGAVLSFVGHVEVYAADAALAGWGLALATDAWRTRRARTTLAAGVCLGLAAALHARELALLPVVLLLAAGAEGRARAVPLVGWFAGVSTVAVVWGAAGVDLADVVARGHPGGGDADLLVPLWTPEPPWSTAPLLSVAHLSDVVQGLLFAAPAALLWPFGAARRDHVVLSVGTAGLLALAVVWNPDFGARADADLLSVVGLALAPWVGARLAAVTTGRDAVEAALGAFVWGGVASVVVARALDLAVQGG